MSTPSRGRPRRPRPAHRARLVGPVVAALAVTVLAAGCSGDAPAGRPTGDGTHTATTSSVSTPPVTTRTQVATVVGRLPGPRRQVVRRQVTSVLDRWWDAAYVEGDYPRSEFARFPGFTPGAARRARYDRDLTSNADIGERAASVTPLLRKARLDLLAVDRRARSVTARFDLRMRVALAGGDGTTRSRRLQVRGRAFLTHRPSGWRIFGYDVVKGWLS